MAVANHVLTAPTPLYSPSSSSFLSHSNFHSSRRPQKVRCMSKNNGGVSMRVAIARPSEPISYTTKLSENPNMRNLQADHLFPDEVARRREANMVNVSDSDAQVISLGIGDTNPQVITSAMPERGHGLSTSSGYRAEQGDEEKLRVLGIDEGDIFISDGAKRDVARLQTPFGSNVTNAMQEPPRPAERHRDHNGAAIVEKDVLSDIQILESVLQLEKNGKGAYEVNGISATKRRAIQFINNFGWLLDKFRSRLAGLESNTVVCSYQQFKRLMDFFMGYKLCAVVKKLLQMMYAGVVELGGHSSPSVALSKMGLIRKAIDMNYMPMVEQLSRYVSESEEFISLVEGSQEKVLFQPDARGPAGLTPLHIPVDKDGSEDVLDARFDFPGKIGIDAWKNAPDDEDTPKDYARPYAGHYAYVHDVQRKFQQSSASRHVVIDNDPRELFVTPRYDEHEAVMFEGGRRRSFPLNSSYRMCDQKKVITYGFLSMVAIIEVCVFVFFIVKSAPNVVCLFQPFAGN